MKKLFSVLACLFLLLGNVSALEIPEHTGFVTDIADVLTENEEIRLDQQIQEIEEQTTAEIAVLTIPSLEGEAA